MVNRYLERVSLRIQCNLSGEVRTRFFRDLNHNGEVMTGNILY